MNLLSVQDDGDGIDRFGTEAAALAENLRGEPVLIMADLFGGSPFMTLLSRLPGHGVCVSDRF